MNEWDENCITFDIQFCTFDFRHKIRHNFFQVMPVPFSDLSFLCLSLCPFSLVYRTSDWDCFTLHTIIVLMLHQMNITTPNKWEILKKNRADLNTDFCPSGINVSCKTYFNWYLCAFVSHTLVLSNCHIIHTFWMEYTI